MTALADRRGNADPSERPRLRAVRLTAEAFAPYGELIRAEGGRSTPVNDGRALRHDGLVGLAHRTGQALPTVAVYEVQASRLPLAVEVFERHPASSQVFLPMQARAYLVAVAPALPEGGPDLDRAEAFVAQGPVGVHYRADVWHVPMTALDEDAVFAMVMWEAGSNDTVEHRLAHPLVIHP